MSAALFNVGATLQRMYRHFYFRICDIVNSVAIVESGELNFEELKHSTEAADIWPGVATYLTIVSDHIKQYRGSPLDLPAFVREAARFGGNKIKPRARFLRVPILPHGPRCTRIKLSMQRRVVMFREPCALDYFHISHRLQRSPVRSPEAPSEFGRSSTVVIAVIQTQTLLTKK